MSVREMFTGRAADDPDRARTFGARLLDRGRADQSELLGTIGGLTDHKAQNFEAAMRTWSQPPAPTIEERLQALEEHT